VPEEALMSGSRRKQERDEFAQFNARITNLNAELREATLSGLLPDQREAYWDQMQASRRGMSVTAWRAYRDRLAGADRRKCGKRR
jgi:hypothetical protein